MMAKSIAAAFRLTALRWRMNALSSLLVRQVFCRSPNALYRGKEKAVTAATVHGKKDK